MTASEAFPTPQISVICIFFNAMAFLTETVESVLGQEYRNFELLLVDDGSRDGSSSIAKAAAEKHPDRISYLQHADGLNHGMSATRNLGIRAARGEFIAFIDADDRWRPSKLQEQLEIFERTPEVDAVFGTVKYWRSWCGGKDELVPTGHVQNVPVPPPEAALALYPLGRAAAPCPSDLMVRRSTVLAVGGFEERFTGPMQMYEDQAFFAKLYLTGTVYFADRNWLYYRIHEASCVAEVSARGQYDSVRRRFLEWLSEYLDQRGDNTSLRVRLALLKAQLPYRVPRLRENVRRVARLVKGSRR